MSETGAVLEEFSRLACRLSPENLWCDGEISKAEAGRRLRQIRIEWKALEAQVGRKVTENEILQYDIAKYEARKGA